MASVPAVTGAAGDPVGADRPRPTHDHPCGRDPVGRDSVDPADRTHGAPDPVLGAADRTHGGPDPVGAADRVLAAVGQAVEEALAGAPAPPGQMYVNWSAAREAADCPARYRAHGEDGWGFPGWSPATAAGSVARAALDRHLDHRLDHHAGATGPGARPVLPDPLEAVRAWVREATAVGDRGVAGWVAERRAEGDAATLAATAAAAGRWLAGFVRVLGWPLPEGLALLNVPSAEGGPPARWWPGPRSPVSVASGADARIGRVRGAGGHTLVVHRPAAGDDRDVWARAAVEAAAGALVHHVAPKAVLVTAGDTGARARIVVDDEVLAAGGTMIAEVVRQRVRATAVGHDPVDATPSAGCRWCDLRPVCPPGAAWVAGPGRWRGGLPIIGPAD
jgi:hypothetical protein